MNNETSSQGRTEIRLDRRQLLLLSATALAATGVCSAHPRQEQSTTTSKRAPSSFGWFGNDGGPLIILPREAQPFWEGTDPPSGGRVVAAEFRWDHLKPDAPATDYDRACDVNDWAQLVDVGSSWGLVLGNESPMAAWIPFANSDRFLAVVAVTCSASFDESVGFFARLHDNRGEQDWERHDRVVWVGQGELLLLHAAFAGKAVREVAFDEPAGDVKVLCVRPGHYAIDFCEARLPAGEHYLLHRFVHQA